MKCGNLDKWTDIHSCENLLLFSQLVNELLFDYSIPSNRVSTLNSHYLCLDALSAVEGVENHGVPEGTVKPIMEELYLALSKDPVFTDKKPLDYFVKYQGDKYCISSKVSDMNYEDLKKTVFALQTCFFVGNQYYEKIKEEITAIIKTNNTNRQKDLYRLVKSMLTELMNLGYSLRYIYEVMNSHYWNPKTEITSAEQIDLFFDAFSMAKNEYDVVFIVNKVKMKNFISFIEDLNFIEKWEPRLNNQFERQFFNLKNREAVISFKVNALDPFAAAKHAQDSLTINASVYRLFDHNYRYDIKTVSCGVYDSNNNFYKLTRERRAVEHTKSLSSKQIKDSMAMSEMAMNSARKSSSYDDLIAIINAAKFHSHSLDSGSEENQLLDLWAIFESVLGISNKHTADRIQQVCMYLVPILKKKYIYSLFFQLSLDIKKYDIATYNEIINSSNEDEIVQKTCEFVLLDIYRDKREMFLSKCMDFPLLKERIEYYSCELNSTEKVFKFVEKHGERVRWQVMRIYRNRNLIIHNAETMPYLTLLIENLHSYVDDFVSYSLEALSKGHNIDSMCQELFVQECQWNADFQKNKTLLNEELIKKMLAL